MTKLSDIILRDTLANRPVAATAGRLYYATDEATLYRDSGSVWESVGGGGPHAFLDHTDVPAAYTGAAGKIVTVNAGANGLEFVTPRYGWIFTAASEAVGITTGTARSGSPYVTQTTFVDLGKTLAVSQVEWRVGDAGTYILSFDGVDIGSSVVAAADDVVIVFTLSPVLMVPAGSHSFSLRDAGGARRARYINALEYRDRYFKRSGWAELAGSYNLPVSLTGIPGTFTQ